MRGTCRDWGSRKVPEAVKRALLTAVGLWLLLEGNRRSYVVDIAWLLLMVGVQDWACGMVLLLLLLGGIQ